MSTLCYTSLWEAIRRWQRGRGQLRRKWLVCYKMLFNLCAPGQQQRHFAQQKKPCWQDGYCQRKGMSVGTSVMCIGGGRYKNQYVWNADFKNASNLEPALELQSHKSSSGLHGVSITAPSWWFPLHNYYSVCFGKFLCTFTIRLFLIFIFLVFYLLIPKSLTDYFTVKICVQLKSIAKHQIKMFCRLGIMAIMVGIFKSVIVNSPHKSNKNVIRIHLFHQGWDDLCGSDRNPWIL